MPQETAPTHPHINPWIIAISVMLSTFMEVLDTTDVNVSLPHIAGSLSVTVDEATWTLTSYLVANAIILPLTGWLSNFFGRKRMLMLSVTGFTIASFLCGLAPSLPFLVVCRIIQGACGGGLQPISQAILLESFPPEDRGKAMGFWGLGIVVAPMLGPVLGGWLTDSHSWRWVFYINVPIGIASIVMTSLFIFDPSYIRRASQKIDYWGIGLLAVGIATLQIVLDKGQEKDWFGTDWITAVAIVTVVSLVAFLIYELRIKDPVVNLRVFKDRTYSTGVFLMSLLGVGLYGTTVLIPLILQTLLGYPAVRAGLAMAPRGLGSFIAMPVAGISMAPIKKENMGNATSLFNLVRNLGGSIGIAAVSTMQIRFQQRNINQLGAHVTPYDASARNMMNSLRGMFMSSGSDIATASHQARAAMFGMVERQASMLAYNSIFLILAGLFVLMLPFIFLMRRPQAKGGPMSVH